MMAMKTDLDHDARPLVVVIEDEDDLRELVLYNLRAEGFEAVGAVTAGEGLALCTLRCPEVVIIDRMLHDTDGIALCAHLRDDSEVADGPHSVILDQVTNGVAVRMALLYLLAGGHPEAVANA